MLFELCKTLLGREELGSVDCLDRLFTRGISFSETYFILGV